MRFCWFLFIILSLHLFLSQSQLFAQSAKDSINISDLKEKGIVLKADEGVIEIETDSVGDKPYKAALYSAVLPGLGQAYNKKYWKMPILYGGGVVIGFFLDYNNRQYKQYRDGFLALSDSDPRTVPFSDRLDQTDYERATNYWRRNRDLLIISTVLVYILNIVDAHVDAHLGAFRISDDLSLNLDPSFNQMVMQTNVIGFSLKLKFN